MKVVIKVKYLGIQIDQHLNRNEHIKNIIPKLTRTKRSPPSPPPLSKICHTYPTIMKPYILPKEDHPLSSAGISIFYWKSANFAILRNTDIYRLYFDALSLILLTFSESERSFL